MDMGSVKVRAPRLVLEGDELAQATVEIDHALAYRPRFPQKL